MHNSIDRLLSLSLFLIRRSFHLRREDEASGNEREENRRRISTVNPMEGFERGRSCSILRTGDVTCAKNPPRNFSLRRVEEVLKVPLDRARTTWKHERSLRESFPRMTCHVHGLSCARTQRAAIVRCVCLPLERKRGRGGGTGHKFPVGFKLLSLSSPRRTPGRFYAFRALAAAEREKFSRERREVEKSKNPGEGWETVGRPRRIPDSTFRLPPP